MIICDKISFNSIFPSLLYMVEIQKIQSKWVGESEKNLAKVFEEYKQAIKFFQKVPILLFNEADAILGKRMSNRNEREVDDQ